jgi:rubrerythrin
MVADLYRVDTIKLADALLCVQCEWLHNGNVCPFCGAREGQLVLAKVLDRREPCPNT